MVESKDNEENLEDMEELNVNEYLAPGRFSIISRTYKDNFSKCTILVFDSDTGKINKEIFEL